MYFQISRTQSLDVSAMQLVMEKLSELRALGETHNLHLHWYKEHWHSLELPPLFAEIFDIRQLDANQIN